MKISSSVLQDLRRLSTHGSEDLSGLLKVLRADPRTFFDNGRWIGIDFSGYDLRGVRFQDAVVVNCCFTEGMLDEEAIKRCQVFLRNHFLSRSVSEKVQLVSLADQVHQTPFQGKDHQSEKHDINGTYVAAPFRGGQVGVTNGPFVSTSPADRMIVGKMRVIGTDIWSSGFSGALCSRSSSEYLQPKVGCPISVIRTNGTEKFRGHITNVGPRNEVVQGVTRPDEFVISIAPFHGFSVGDEVLCFETDEEKDRRLSASANSRSLASIVRLKMTYEEMIEKGWNPPLRLVKRLIQSSESFDQAWQYLSDLVSRNVKIDTGTLDLVYSKAGSLGERIEFLDSFPPDSQGAHYFGQRIFRECSSEAEWTQLWGVIQHRPDLVRTCGHIFISRAPSGTSARAVTQRMISMRLPLGRDIFLSLLSFDDDTAATRKVLLSATKNGFPFVGSILSEFDAKLS